MADDIIDLTSYLDRGGQADVPRGAMALWGADGERARFALPLWRIIYLAEAERGVIVWCPQEAGGRPVPFVALDLAEEPARTVVSGRLPRYSEDHDPELIDRGRAGLVVHLGARDGRSWSLVVDGGEERVAPLETRTREDILFLAGECAGLLFLRDLADEAAPSGEET
jgi:hypothetical protein